MESIETRPGNLFTWRLNRRHWDRYLLETGWICDLVTGPVIVLLLKNISFLKSSWYWRISDLYYFFYLKVNQCVLLLKIGLFYWHQVRLYCPWSILLRNKTDMSHFVNIAWLLKTPKGCEILSVNNIMIRFVARTYPPCWVLKARIQKHRGKPLLFHDKWSWVLLRALHNTRDLQLYVPSEWTKQL